MSRIVLAAVMIFFSAEAVRAGDDFKTCATGAPDYAILACTNLMEGGKLDLREQAIAYTNRGVAFRNRGGYLGARSPISIAPSRSPPTRRPFMPIAASSICSRESLILLLQISTVR